MLMLKLVIHNGGYMKRDNPIYLNIPVPPELAIAIKETGKPSGVELLFHEQGKAGHLSRPMFPKYEGTSEIVDFRLNLGG